MGKLVGNENLNYWLCGFIFAIIFGIVTWIISVVATIPVLGGVIYFIVMPYIAGRLVDFVSDKWMD